MKLVEALLEARKVMVNPPLNGVGHAGKNGAREYKYALLSDVLSCVMPPLLDNGVLLTQCIEDGVLKTVAYCGDESMVLDSRKVNMSGTSQEQGSAETYAKRYALCTVFCLSGIEDDDGAAAQNQPRRGQNPNGGQTRPQTGSPSRFARISQLKQTAMDLGIKEEGIKAWIDATFPMPMKDFGPDEIAETEQHLMQLIRDKRQLQAELDG